MDSIHFTMTQTILPANDIQRYFHKYIHYDKDLYEKGCMLYETHARYIRRSRQPYASHRR